jgi:hypothetical protein
MEIDREALEGILGSFRWLLTYGLLTSSTFYFMSDLHSCTTKLDEPRVLFVCCTASQELRV